VEQKQRRVPPKNIYIHKYKYINCLKNGFASQSRYRALNSFSQLEPKIVTTSRRFSRFKASGEICNYMMLFCLWYRSIKLKCSGFIHKAYQLMQSEWIKFLSSKSPKLCTASSLQKNVVAPRNMTSPIALRSSISSARPRKTGSIGRKWLICKGMTHKVFFQWKSINMFHLNIPEEVFYTNV